MSFAGPFQDTPQLVERTTNLIDLMMRNDPAIPAWRLYQHRTLNDAYGNPAGVGGANSGVGGAGPVEVLIVERDRSFWSPTIQRNGRGMVEENRRGQTRIVWDPDDYAGVDEPADDEVRFLRLQEQQINGIWRTVVGLVNNGDPVLGPIFIVPNPIFFGTNIPILNVSGTAPANTGSTDGSVPVVNEDSQLPNPMHVVLPRPTSSITISNHSGADELLVSFGLGQIMSSVDPGDEATIFGAAMKDVVVASSDNGGPGAATVTFSIKAVVALGPGS